MVETERLIDMAVFARVVETKSFTAAGKELRMSISAVSKHVAKLEAALSTKLLERSSRHLGPTASGRVFYEHCIRILSAVEHARSEVLGVSGEIGGILRVHSTPSIGTNLVAPATLDFTKAYSELKVELTIGTLPVDPANRGLDVIVTSGDTAESAPKAYDSLVTRKLGAVPYVACASPDYLSRHGMPKKVEELRQRPCLVHLNAKRNPNQWGFVENRSSFVVLVNSRYRSSSVSAVLAAAVEGLGIAILPKYAVRSELDAGRLKAIFAGSIQSERVVRVYYGRSRQVPRKVRAFIELLQLRYKKMKS
jgi:DNA-binding transcriptional LysR family regulator